MWWWQQQLWSVVLSTMWRLSFADDYWVQWSAARATIMCICGCSIGYTVQEMNKRSIVSRSINRSDGWKREKGRTMYRQRWTKKNDNQPGSYSLGIRAVDLALHSFGMIGKSILCFFKHRYKFLSALLIPCGFGSFLCIQRTIGMKIKHLAGAKRLIPKRNYRFLVSWIF